MGARTQGQMLHLNKYYPTRTHIDEENYKAINTTYQRRRKQNKKESYQRQLAHNIKKINNIENVTII